jgi:ADP-ribose pyrophosphatase YjhB (NUDIX family)
MFSIGAFAIIFDEGGRVLLSHRRDIDAWDLPGGGVESRELPGEAVIRETKEETGLDVVVERLVGVYGKVDKDEIVFAFVCRVVGGQMTPSDESDEHGYFAVDQIPSNTLPKHVERIQDAFHPAAAPVFRRQAGPSIHAILDQAKSP